PAAFGPWPEAVQQTDVAQIFCQKAQQLRLAEIPETGIHAEAGHFRVEAAHDRQQAFHVPAHGVVAVQHACDEPVDEVDDLHDGPCGQLRSGCRGRVTCHGLQLCRRQARQGDVDDAVMRLEATYDEVYTGSRL